MELHEFHVLQWQASAQHHAAAGPRARMRGRRVEIAATIAAGCQNYIMCAETMDRTVLHAERDHTPAYAIFHDEIEREIFDEEIGVVFQALLIKRVQHGVAGAVGSGAGALRRRSRAHILHHAAEGALIRSEEHTSELQSLMRIS